MSDENQNTNLPENLSSMSNQNYQPEKEDSFKSFVWETIKIVIICLIIVVPIRKFVVQPFYVKGASMEPNFYDHEYLIIDEITYRFENPERGEIVVFNYPVGENSFYIKRLIGLPGERVVISGGTIMIYNQDNSNGIELDESSYLSKDAKTYGEVDITLAEGQYYVMGDNRASSLDSRKLGPIEENTIVGKTWLRGWPIDRFKVFVRPEYGF